MKGKPRQKARVLLFTGEGKGKTSAALGLVLRACGHHLPALIVQFIKADASTGEVAACARLPRVKLVQAGLGFVPPRTDRRFAAHRAAAQAGFKLAAAALAQDQFAVVVLDEICTAIDKRLLDGESVAAVVARAPAGKIVVLTGRAASKRLADLADTVTEMRCVKHGYQRGLKAQRGVEF